MSNITALLREAASEIANEEKEAAEENIKIAAEQIEADLSAKSHKGSLSPRSISSAKHADINVNEDVHALLEQMSIKPKYSGNAIDDVDALLNLHQKKTGKSARTNASMDDYRRRKSAHSIAMSSNKSLASSRTSGAVVNYASEMSKVAALLSVSDERPWGKDIKSAFANPQQERLFRSMKVVRPATAATTSANRRSSTGGGALSGGNSTYSGYGGSGSRHSLSASSSNLRPSSSSSATGIAAYNNSNIDPRHMTSDLSKHSLRRRGDPSDAECKAQQRQEMRTSAERLSSCTVRQPSKSDLKVDPTLGYSTLADAKECYFHPRINGKEKKKSRGNRRGRNDDDDEENRPEDKFAFINRQEAEERNRRDELEFQIGKAKYDALVDKKACPQCGSKQSYDEFKEKRKSCSVCNVEYCAQVSGGE